MKDEIRVCWLVEFTKKKMAKYKHVLNYLEISKKKKN